MKRPLEILLVLTVVVGLGAAGCSGDSSADPAEAADEGGEENAAAIPVEVVALATGPIEEVLRYSTNLEAEEEVAVYSQSARQVVQLNVEEGAEVRRGQVLVRLQDEEQRNTLAKVTAELDRARREYERQTRLHESQLISDQAFNDATHELEQLQLQQADARRELSYTTVVAPISGIITRRLVSLGDQVTPNQHLFDLVDFDSIVARVYVPEKELPGLRKGLPARVVAPSLGHAWAGRVERLSPVVDPKTGTVKVTVAIPRQAGLRPGMYVDVQLVTEVRDEALLVPKRALVYDRDQLFVYRMGEDRKVERVYLEPELEDERFVLPRGDQLAAGDRVVIAGQAGLKPGATVRLAGEKAEPAADEEEVAAADGERRGARGR
ncbi:MAG TPA: efflux RND transporter periplasmic adaptor subunit [Thermoanaerobaculia bacterium]|nr:efflux RND transporter periplasmic adaptor subunit [Thermoanaerobaculia bacterium]